MAKRVVKKKDPELANLSQSNKDSIAALRGRASKLLHYTCKAMRTEYNDSRIAVAGEAGCIVLGIPFNTLALEYLFQNTVFPLGRMTQVVGTEGTCKSAFCFELSRLFHEQAGTSYLLENESKYSPDYANSIIGWPANPNENALGYIPCGSLEDWQSRMLDVVSRIKGSELGMKLPVLLILDSIMGKLSVESQQNIDRAGFADRAFPVEALKINNFLKKFPQDIEGWPMSFVAVNHLKPQKSEHGMHTERHKAGGRSISFQETFEIEMSRDKNPHIRLVDEQSFEIGGLNLQLACKKNSLGETDRKIKAAVKWTHRPIGPDGEYLQVTKWDWPEATVKLLTSFDKGHRASRIKEIVNIQGSGQRFWCNDIGISKEAAVTAHDLGVVIERDTKRVDELRKLFGIKTRAVFQPGVSYSKQIETERKKAEEALEELEAETEVESA
jgi:hypothetical protein